MSKNMQAYDASTLKLLRRALDEVLTDQRFLKCPTASAIEVAEHILAEAATGERDIGRLKMSALERLPK
jgi:hypothetical protein